MRCATLTTTLLLLCLTHVASARESLDALHDAVAAIEPQVIAWRRDIHQHPELSNREFRTAKLVADHLRSIGVDEVRTGIAHTGVVGVLKGRMDGPVIALRADMDGLPVREQTGLPFASRAKGEYNGEEVYVMHACGHDTHVAMLMGAAQVLAENREQLAGTVHFIFQPAEEGAPAGEEGGAALMIKEGVLEGADAPEAIFGIHAWPTRVGTLSYRYGPFMAAADTFQIDVRGRQTHGSAPWAGVDPIFVAAQIMTAVQAIPSRQLDITRGPAVITIGSIHGGVRHNIIPDDVVMQGTIRTFDAGEREKLHARLRKTITNIADASGASATLTMEGYAPVTSNHPQLLREMMPAFEWAAGPDNVIEHPLITGAEDFSRFQTLVPGLYLMLGVAKDNQPLGQGPVNHSPLFDSNEDALIVGVRAHVGFAMGYASRNR